MKIATTNISKQERTAGKDTYENKKLKALYIILIKVKLRWKENYLYDQKSSVSYRKTIVMKNMLNM